MSSMSLSVSLVTVFIFFLQATASQLGFLISVVEVRRYKVWEERILFKEHYLEEENVEYALPFTNVYMFSSFG